MTTKPASAQLLKRRFCLGDSSGCARHKVFKAAGGQFVPGDLYPTQTERVRAIVSEARKA